MPSHAVITVTDWKTDTRNIPGSIFSTDVYYACYTLAIGAADALEVLHPELKITCNTFEKAFRRFACQYQLTTQHEVVMHSKDVIGHVVREAAREAGVGFVPPF